MGKLMLGTQRVSKAIGGQLEDSVGKYEMNVGEQTTNPLPAGYLRLEYIQSTGTQYIDTNYYPNMTTEIETEFQFTEIVNFQWLFGARWTQSPTYDTFAFTDGASANTDLYFNRGRNNLGGVWQLTGSSAKYTDRGVLTLKNAVFKWFTWEINCSDSLFPLASTDPMGIFGGYNNGWSSTNTKAKLWSFKIWDNGTLVRNFIPALRKSDYKPGLYDTANNVFYTNAGTGEFTYQELPTQDPSIKFCNLISSLTLPVGYRRLEYIQSTATQYIDTGYAPNQETDVEYSCRQTGSWSYNAPQTFFGMADSIWSDNSLAVSTYQNGAYGWDNMGDSGWQSFTVTLDQDTIFRLNKNGLYKDNALVRSNFGYVRTQSVKSILFFAANYYTITEYGQHRLYYSKIWDNGTLVRNFIPALRTSDSKPGLYDVINGQFYTNQGTGEFLYIPTEYKSVNYIEDSIGTCWIDTGFKLNQDSRVVCNYMVTQYQTDYTYDISPFGARAGWLNNMFGFYSPVNSQTSTYMIYQNQTKSTSISNILNSPITIDANKNSWQFSINGSNYSNSFTYTAFQNQGNCYLFKCNYYNEWSPTGVSTGANGHQRMWYCQIYDNGTLIRNYVPVIRRSDSKPGFYDLCGSTCTLTNSPFYINAGTGEFTYA